jgi:hypothetical protein
MCAHVYGYILADFFLYPMRGGLYRRYWPMFEKRGLSLRVFSKRRYFHRTINELEDHQYTCKKYQWHRPWNIHLVRLSLEDLPNDSNMYYGVKCTPGPIICSPHLAISKTLVTTHNLLLYAIFETKAFQPRETCIQGCATYEYIHKHYIAYHSKHLDWYHSLPFDLALQ